MERRVDLYRKAQGLGWTQPLWPGVTASQLQQIILEKNDEKYRNVVSTTSVHVPPPTTRTINTPVVSNEVRKLLFDVMNRLSTELDKKTGLGITILTTSDRLRPITAADDIKIIMREIEGSLESLEFFDSEVEKRTATVIPDF